jgi:hypothetical protein
MRHSITRFAVAAALLAGIACGADRLTSTSERTTEELNLLHVTYDYPSLVATQVSFWAVKGRPSGADLWYHARPGSSDSTRFVQFRVPAGALDRRPDGSAIAAGDSVLITLTAKDARHMMISFQPSGLRFSAAEKPMLAISWVACGDDLNYDGSVDAGDAALVSQLGIWRQETDTAPWSALATTVSPLSRTVSTLLDGFTGYAISY